MGIRSPMRLLCIGLPLTIASGTVVAVALLSDLELWECAIVAAVLAPTDAALGQAVVTNPALPLRIRQGLNVESGLNDGGSVPFLTLFIGLAAAEEGLGGGWLRFAVEQIGYGTLTSRLLQQMEEESIVALRVGNSRTLFFPW